MRGKRKRGNEENENQKTEVKQKEESSLKNENETSTMTTRSKTSLRDPFVGLDPQAIKEKILRTKHPLEKSHYIESKGLTPSQRAITCCIQLCGGEASEEQLVYFLRNNWQVISTMSSRTPNIPDMRVLRINLSVKKKSIPLFTQKQGEENVWCLTETPEGFYPPKNRTTTNVKESRTFENRETFQQMIHKENPNSFEGKLTEIIKKFPDGILFNDIVKELESYSNSPGLFPTLPLSRRIHSILLAKKKMNMVTNDGDLWKIETNDNQKTNRNENSIRRNENFPPFLRTVRIRDLTIDELYTILKENKVY